MVEPFFPGRRLRTAREATRSPETAKSCPDGAAHVKSWSMCAESPFGRARLWLRKSLAGLRLCHGLQGGGAAPETEAVVVATHLFRCLSWHLRRLGCAFHPSRRGGSLRVQQSFAGRPEDTHGRVRFELCGVPRATVSRSALVPTVPARTVFASVSSAASKRRRSPRIGSETRTGADA